MSKNLFINTLPTNTAELIKIINNVSPDFLNRFYLSGGTALSLQIGHRKSEDLDFFSQKSFDPQLLQQELLVLSFRQSRLEVIKKILLICISYSRDIR